MSCVCVEVATAVLICRWARQLSLVFEPYSGLLITSAIHWIV